MRIYIMTDLEGVCGIVGFLDWCYRDSRYYNKAKEFLTLEVNAAIEGFIDAGADEFLVVDGDGAGGIDQLMLHPKAEYVGKWPAGEVSFSLIEGRFDFAAWIGQHPMAGTKAGHLSHTGNMGVIEQSINGIPVGEFGDLVFLATELGIRVILATGCEAFCREAEALLPGIETVSVKKGTQTDPGNHLPREAYKTHNISAIHLSPLEARRRIKQGAKRALTRAQTEEFGLAKLPPPPYTKIRVIRTDGQNPPRILKQGPQKSILEMRRATMSVKELPINPADPRFR